MNIIKVKYGSEIPEDYTGIVEWEDGQVWWFKDGEWHREDGPAYIGYNGYKEYRLDGIFICSSFSNFDLTNCVMVSKEPHPEYSTVQVWKYLDKNGIQEQIVIPGMEVFN